LTQNKESLLEKNIWTSNPKQKKIVITTKHPQIIATHHDMSPISPIHHPLTICSYGGEHEKVGRMASTNYTLSSKKKKLSSPLDIVVYQNISYALMTMNDHECTVCRFVRLPFSSCCVSLFNSASHRNGDRLTPEVSHHSTLIFPRLTLCLKDFPQRLPRMSSEPPSADHKDLHPPWKKRR
jgi:hypothetical protein